jgi:D-tyrosyl-tRNA(Tyr) deacylase
MRTRGESTGAACATEASKKVTTSARKRREYTSSFVVKVRLMRAVVQRVSRGSVTVDGEVLGEIGRGLVVLVGAAETDTQADADLIADKLVGLRIFPDAAGAMNLALGDVGGELLVVSQFTLLGDARKGRRPSFIAAMKPEPAAALYDYFVTACRARTPKVATGRFRADMKVDLCNDGPVTILLDSTRLF